MFHMADSRSLSLVLCVWSIVRWDFKGTRLIYLIETEEGGANMIMQKSSRDTIVHLLQNRRRRVHEHCSSVDSLGIKIRVHHYFFFSLSVFGHWKKLPYDEYINNTYKGNHFWWLFNVLYIFFWALFWYYHSTFLSFLTFLFSEETYQERRSKTK